METAYKQDKWKTATEQQTIHVQTSRHRQVISYCYSCVPVMNAALHILHWENFPLHVVYGATDYL